MEASFRQGRLASRRLAACQIICRATSICGSPCRPAGIAPPDAGRDGTLPVLGVARRLRRRRGPCHGLGADGNPAGFQIGQGDLCQPSPLGSQTGFRPVSAVLRQIYCRVGGVLLIFPPAGYDVSRRVGQDQETGDAFLASGRIGHGKDDGELTFATGGDELLGAILVPSDRHLAAPWCAGRQRRNRYVGLGERSSQPFPARQSGE